MKKNYGSIITAHRVSGVGVNMTTMQLDCTDEQCEEMIKVRVLFSQKYCVCLSCFGNR